MAIARSMARRSVRASCDHEMFTGKRAFEDARRATPASASTLVKDIDPAVERLILRCLEKDPRNRPASALAVARALPGGDPLAAAIAAGETPSPEMVAAAGETEGFSLRTLGLLLALVVVGLAACLWLAAATNVPQMIPFEMTPEALAHQSRQLIASFGYTSPPLDRAFGFGSDTEFRRYGERSEKPADYRAQLTAGQPALAYFWYRQSPRYLEPVNAYGAVTASDPPAEVSGMVQLQLDPQGRMLTFHAVPPQVESPAATANPPDWNRFFAAAGLDPARFTAAEPQWAPLAHFDARAAWTGSFPQAAGVALRVEAASWRGRLVDFRLIGPWTRPERMQPFELTSGEQVGQWVFILVPVLVFLAAMLFAWRNLRMRRGDTRGALRVSAVILCCSLLKWACFAHHVPMRSEYDGSTWALSAALFLAAVFWVIYVAAEPYIRRRWPKSLISWSRLVAGGFRDPLVGAHTLMGVALGIGITLLSSAPYYWLRPSGAINDFAASSALLGLRRAIGLILCYVPESIYYSSSSCSSFSVRQKNLWVSSGSGSLPSE